jgi:hypothetical protein
MQILSLPIQSILLIFKKKPAPDQAFAVFRDVAATCTDALMIMDGWLMNQ